MTKAKYRLKNWAEYNKSLINRGSINLWIDEDLEKDWFYKKPSKRDKNKKLGRSFTYSNKAIELCLIIRNIFKLNLRMTQGFLTSLFPKFNLDHPEIPSHPSIHLTLNQF